MAGKPGRPCWMPSDSDREKIQMMAALGSQEEKISKIFKVAEKTLRKHCREELATGEAVANSAVGRFLYDAATDKETYVKEDGTIGIRHIGASSATVTAAIFWMKPAPIGKSCSSMAVTVPKAASHRLVRIRQAPLVVR